MLPVAALLALAACGGQPARDPDLCTPMTCNAQQKNCGTILDGCGGTLECGDCAAGETCGANGANVCGEGTCTPTTCAAEQKNCGPISDGCSMILSCGTCAGPGFCGGSGVDNVCGQDVYATSPGCLGVYNPDQILEYHLSTISPGPAQFACGNEPSILVEVETKRGGGFKIDTNTYVVNQTHHNLKKLVFDSIAIQDNIRQYLAWRVMNLAGAVSGRAVFAKVYVNGALAGVYLNIEAVDKRFLLSRFGNDEGWLYKKSGGGGDGLKTHENDGLADANPYDDYFCFWRPNGCSPPGDVSSSLSTHLDVEQFLRMGAANALVANTDSPIYKDNNYYYYDWPGKRAYLPWDLDTVMKDISYDVFQDTAFSGVLFPHWEAQYDQILTGLLSGPLTLAAIHAELDRLLAVAGPALGPTAASDIAGIKAYWNSRHPAVQGQVDAH